MSYNFIFEEDVAAYVLNSPSKEEIIIDNLDDWQKKRNAGQYEKLPNVSYKLVTFIGNQVILKKKTIIEPEDVIETGPSIPPGIFLAGYSMNYGLKLQPMNPSTDKFYKLSNINEQLESDIDFFLENEDKYNELNLIHKRGLLLVGPPGNGKTVTIQNVAQKYKDKARIIFISGPSDFVTLINPVIFQALNDLPIIIVIEEITSIYEASWAQSTMKSFLDGELSWINTITIATTNYPEQLPNELINRPARFDKIYLVDNPNEATRRAYLKELLKSEYMESLISKTEGMSLAYLRELVVASKIYNRSISDIINEFQERAKIVKNGLSKEE